MEETAQDILKQIPQPVDVEEVTLKYPVLYQQSMNTVLIQEIIRLVSLSRSFLTRLSLMCNLGNYHFKPQTDRQTDRQTDGRTDRHCQCLTL